MLNESYLKCLTASFNINPDSNRNNNNYLTHVSKLTENEKFVAILIDEIYVDPSLQYKKNHVVGFAENDELSTARTVQAFMITSIFGNFKEICRLTPVKCMKSDFLLNLTKNVIHQVQSLGFTVLTIVSDNNRVNQNLFKLLDPCNTGSFQNPNYPDSKIYMLYDCVHIYKNIKNNWMNLKNLDKTFVYPDFETSIIKKASFENLRKTYHLEKDQLVKKSL